MNCPRCATPRVDGRRYCWSCGVRHVPADTGAGVCARCGYQNAAAHHWCGGCGQAMLPDAAEWRQLTVMFCDLVGSTAMSAVLDPEDLREVNRAYQDAATHAIERYGGFVARYMGDGVLAYFGWPRAHEDDPARAVGAALEVIEAMGDVQRRVADKKVDVQVRVGIATGRVVVGDLVGEGAAQEAAVVGETPNLAARLQGEAEPNGVVISGATRRRLGAGWQVESLGERMLKGMPEPVEIFAVRAARQVGERAESAPLMGRGDDVAWLEARWQALEQGGQLVRVVGEAGIGKSHLLAAWLEGKPHHVLRASAWDSGRALHPVVQWAMSRPLDAPTTELVDWARTRADTSDPSKRAALLDRLVTEVLAGTGPRAVLVEDAHWLDPTSLDWLQQVAARLDAEPVLVVVSYRPPFEIPGAPEDCLELGRVDGTCARAIVRTVAPGLPDEVVADIVAKTDGIPLFVEELTRALVDSGQLERRGDQWVLLGALDELAVPDTLQDSLMARLDQLGYAKALAQTASVVGRQFNRLDLEVLSGLADHDLDDNLARLASARVFVPDGEVWRFRHALLQEIAYDSLLRSRRRVLHTRYAEHLAAIEAAPALQARHLAAAGQALAAVPHWVQAGRDSAHHAAMAEALSYLNEALTAADADPACPADVAVEVRLELARWQRNQNAPAALKLLEHAQRLAGGSDDWLSQIHFQKGNLYFHLGRTQDCVREHELAQRHAAASGSRRLEASALGGMGDALYMAGDMVGAAARFTACVEVCEAEGFAWEEAANRVMIGWSALQCADFERAEQQLQKAHAQTQAIQHHRSRCVASGGLAFLADLMERPDAAQRASDEAWRVASDLGMHNFVVAGLYYRARAALMRGDTAAAQQLVDEGIASVAAGKGLRFIASGLMAISAQLATSDEARQALVERGWSLIDERVMPASRMWFHREAMRATSGVERQRHIDALRAMGPQYPLAQRLADGG